MGAWRFKAPVAIFVFNQLATTKRVFEVLRQVKPAKLFVIADGPRSNCRDDINKVQAVRRLFDCINWDCEVIKHYSSINLGCKQCVSSGIDAVFETVEEAIILEHDTVPYPTFFFCDELLERYRDDSRIMMITGQNIQFGRERTKFSYYFSRYPLIWGWATWKRAWQCYDVQMQEWPQVKLSASLENVFTDLRTLQYWDCILNDTYEGKIDTWDYQWMLSCWLQNGLTITPHVNLVSNIGFNKDSLHNTNADNQYANMPVEAIEFPLQHPPFVVHHIEADNFAQDTAFSPHFFRRVIAKLKKIWKKMYLWAVVESS